MITKKYKVLGLITISMLLVVVVYELLTSGSLLESKNKPINFYKKDGLMWLIDTTVKNREYAQRTISDYGSKSKSKGANSYENYLNYVNTNASYRYHNWRVPTEEELMKLEYKGSFFKRLFTSSKHVKHDISIDKDIFYDHKIRHVRHYRTNTPCKKGEVYGHYISQDDGRIIINFNGLRFDQYKFGKGGARGGDGASVRCGSFTGIGQFRFVRDSENFIDTLIQKLKEL